MMDRDYCRHDLNICTGECLLVEQTLQQARNRFLAERIPTFGNPMALQETVRAAAPDSITADFAQTAVAEVCGRQRIWTRDQVVALLEATIQAVKANRP